MEHDAEDDEKSIPTECRPESENVVRNAFVAVHVGAGMHKSAHTLRLKKRCKIVCAEVIARLKNGQSALEACCYAVALLENDPLTNAGHGSNLTIDGQVECDACVMDGHSLISGACGAVPCVKNPVYLAKWILENQMKEDSSGTGLVPPILLCGNGALDCAKSAGLEVVDPDYLVTPLQKSRREKLLQRIQTPSVEKSALDIGESEEAALDTVGAVVVDLSGNVASAASSGGLSLKHSGRIGQAAIVGAGVWAENHANLAAAACTSGTGEQLIQTSLARQLCQLLIADENAQLSDLIEEKFLKSKFITGNHPRLMACLLVQISDWNTASQFGLLQIGHTTPIFCWAMQRSEGQSTAQAFVSIKHPDSPFAVSGYTI